MNPASRAATLKVDRLLSELPDILSNAALVSPEGHALTNHRHTIKAARAEIRDMTRRYTVLEQEIIELTNENARLWNESVLPQDDCSQVRGDSAHLRDKNAQLTDKNGRLRDENDRNFQLWDELSEAWD